MEPSYLREKEIGTRIDVSRSVSQALEGSISGYHYDYYQDHLLATKAGVTRRIKVVLRSSLSWIIQTDNHRNSLSGDQAPPSLQDRCAFHQYHMP